MKSIRCRWRRGEKISFFDKVISLEEKLLRYASFLFSVIALYLINTEAESWVLIFTGNRQGGLVGKSVFTGPQKPVSLSRNLIHQLLSKGIMKN